MAEQDRYSAHFSTQRDNPLSIATTVGIFKSTIFPSFAFHTGLSLVTYGVSRYTDRADGKDCLWPASQLANAWWSALGTRVVYDGLSLPDAWAQLTYSERLLLTGVTTWGIRLLYRIASRAVRRGADDPRYAEDKRDPGFWSKAFLTQFLPEAAVQTLITLPFTLPFRAGLARAPLPTYAKLAHAAAVFLFSSGYALEVLADTQLETHKQRTGDIVLNREGVWSIVRHPNYLGDALVHFSFPVLLYSAGLLHPLALLGPLANYVYLRVLGGDRETERFQEEAYKADPLKYEQFRHFRREKNSFWPGLKELANGWTWAIVAVGLGGVAVEKGMRTWL
ncbi:uncharacterized protein B0H18DRAFT_1115187 [Fomitopsis serialis]|uniref:uncharacterized protein n=1 Tax=Fomitopsis serialis TaxID=139415 RepID=UPI002007BF1C|nr:uncharacterized protein B0H18DRAFT_1115187 [Neoantrodia serialis]KAH9933816.1 hypothetical protein B0H18DRAFT_1115187 [Neoantrodia serialis]